LVHSFRFVCLGVCLCEFELLLSCFIYSSSVLGYHKLYKTTVAHSSIMFVTTMMEVELRRSRQPDC